MYEVAGLEVGYSTGGGWLDERGLGYDALRQANPEVIVVSITPFGESGPYASFKASDLTLYHMSGQAHGVLGPVDDPDNNPPIRAGGHQAEFLAGMAAAGAKDRRIVIEDLYWGVLSSREFLFNH